MQLYHTDGMPEKAMRLKFSTAHGNATEKCALAALAYLATKHEVDVLEPVQQMRSLTLVSNAAGAQKPPTLPLQSAAADRAAARRRRATSSNEGGSANVQNELGAVSVQSGVSLDGTPLWAAGITGAGQFVQVSVLMIFGVVNVFILTNTCSSAFRHRV